MLACEFHMTYDFIGEQMDLESFYGCMRYREFNPPMGALFSAFMNSFTDGGEKVKMGTANTPMVQSDDNGSLSDLVQAFGGWGGTIKVAGGE